jgi:hypothetical protein
MAIKLLIGLGHVPQKRVVGISSMSFICRMAYSHERNSTCQMAQSSLGTFSTHLNYIRKNKKH